MADNLVIVESPAKAKTIEKFLGNNYVVKSSYGHVRDLVKNDKGIDIEKNFAPKYEVSADKAKVVDELKKLSKKAKMVWLATDEDREGEAISWHLFESLGLEKKHTKRIVFHEITKPAIMEAIENPRFIDMNLVDAQQARRILDRLVGFELSPILWKKVKPSLSAGRVQSVTVRLIVEREREIEGFNTTSAFKVTAEFLVDGKSTLKAELAQRFTKEKDAHAFLEKLVGAHFKIENLEKKPGKKSPAAPFTTSTLQQEASRKLGFSVGQTMVIAQKLYESGKITYMRTDSVNLSGLAITAAKNVITKEYGKEYSNPRQYKTKSANAQEAHEAIRPSYLDQPTVEGERNEQRLYDLIWKRTIASQMSDAELERTVVTINNDKTKDLFVATGEVIRFDGFLRVYMESSDDETKEDTATGLLPPLKKGQTLEVNNITATERFTSPPARYTEASLVKKLEELGIGRPSTYAPTISTVQKRGYAIKEDRAGKERIFSIITLKGGKIKEEKKQETFASEKSKLFPTDIGTVVTDFLKLNFGEIMDYSFTATVEKEFDEVAQGNIKWEKMIKDFYGPFHKTVMNTEKNSERATGERILGVDPVSKKQVSARIGKFGPLVQLSTGKEDEKPQYARLRVGQRLETISLEEALDLFKMPRNVGQFDHEDVVVAIGRFGPYARHKSAFYSLAKTDDPYTVDLERCIEIIKNKWQADKDRIIKTFQNNEVQVLKGRWGPYLVANNKNYRLPKGVEAETLTLDDCLTIVKNDKTGGRPARGKSKTTETAKPFKAAAAKKVAAKKAAGKKVAVAVKKVAGKKVAVAAAVAVKKVAAPVKKTAVKKVAAKKVVVKKSTVKKK
jgi:DNA topoisomerase I